MSDQGQQTYQRAIVGALLGLGVQTLSALVLLAVAFSGDPAAMLPAVWYAFAGIPVWLVLVLLYHQHRLEREEALESERLARQAPESRLFGEAGDALSLSRRRLQKMYGLVLPLTGVLVGAYLMAGGLWRLGEAQASLAPTPNRFTASNARSSAWPSVWAWRSWTSWSGATWPG
ncbi:MAG: hypothetical protein M5U26_09040 [Planctomycetota bacterium]|nr:hypothetical protein [Planctomycetota bacterium]